MVEATAPAALAGAASVEQSDELPLSVGATLTLRAAERHAARAGAGAVAPSHLLIALLERPDPSVKAHIAESGASVTWLCDTAFSGVTNLPGLRGPSLDSVLALARRKAEGLGKSRVNDLCLFLAIEERGDALSDRLLAEAGVCKLQTATLATTSAEIDALVAAPGPFGPRLGTPVWTAPVAGSRRRRNLAALVAAMEISTLFLAMLAVVIGSGLVLALQPATQYARPLIITFIVSSYLVSLCMHEFGHAAAAFLTGERRVRDQGYLTLDIRRYSNPMLTFILPMLSLIIGAIPLPGACVWLRPSAFRTVREDRLISAAGPLANFVCLLILSIPLQLGMDQYTPVGVALAGAAGLQAGVIIFNLLPVPPLDGWQIYTAGASPQFRAQAAALGFMPLIALFLLFRMSPELSATYWNAVDWLGALFGVDWWASWFGRSMLFFR